MPINQPVGPANAYLILNPPYTLIDAGPNNPEAHSILIGDLQAKGIAGKLERIILTHVHPDHAGLVNSLQELTDAEIFIHELELSNAKDGYWAKALKLINKFGLSGSEYQALIDEFERRNRQHQPLYGPLRILQAGDKLVFQDFSLTVLHLPGHTPGSIGLFDEYSGTLFSGDALLPDVSPNALIETDNQGNCVPMARAYLESLEALMSYDLKQVYPGHGQPFSEWEVQVRRVISNYRARMSELDGLLSPGIYSLKAVAEKLYPNALGFEFYLAVSKIIGLVELLAMTGRGAMVEKDGQIWVKKEGPAPFSPN